MTLSVPSGQPMTHALWLSSQTPTCTHPAMHTNKHNPIQMAGLEPVSGLTIEWITYPSSEF